MAAPSIALIVAAPSVGSGRKPSSLERGLAAPWLRFALLATPVFAVTVFSKLTIPPLGEQGIDISLFFLLGAPLVGSICGCIRFDPRRLALYTALVATLGLIQILQPEFSITSLLLLVALHLPYVFGLSHPDDGQRINRFFINLVTLFAWLGIAQYALQFFINPRFLFPIENFVPNSFIVQHFNRQAALSYGSEIYRANGVFLLEPSFFSQVLAVAIVAELCTLRRITRLAPFGIALLASYSGTGILVLAICLPLYALSRRHWGLLLLGIFALAAVIGLQEAFHLGGFLSRAGEFGSTQSSGFARFVGGFYLFDQFLWNDPWRTLFGYGAGAFTTYASHAAYVVAEMAVFKIIFEFGLIGATVYFGFLFGCLFYSRAPRLLVLAVGLTYLLNGIYTPFAHGLALSLLLWNSLPNGLPNRPATAVKAGI